MASGNLRYSINDTTPSSTPYFFDSAEIAHPSTATCTLSHRGHQSSGSPSLLCKTECPQSLHGSPRQGQQWSRDENGLVSSSLPDISERDPSLSNFYEPANLSQWRPETGSHHSDVSNKDWRCWMSSSIDNGTSNLENNMINGHAMSTGAHDTNYVDTTHQRYSLAQTNDSAHSLPLPDGTSLFCHLDRIGSDQNEIQNVCSLSGLGNDASPLWGQHNQRSKSNSRELVPYTVRPKRYSANNHGIDKVMKQNSLARSNSFGIQALSTTWDLEVRPYTTRMPTPSNIVQFGRFPNGNFSNSTTVRFCALSRCEYSNHGSPTCSASLISSPSTPSPILTPSATKTPTPLTPTIQHNQNRDEPKKDAVSHFVSTENWVEVSLINDEERNNIAHWNNGKSDRSLRYSFGLDSTPDQPIKSWKDDTTMNTNLSTVGARSSTRANNSHTDNGNLARSENDEKDTIEWVIKTEPEDDSAQGTNTVITPATNSISTDPVITNSGKHMETAQLSYAIDGQTPGAVLSFLCNQNASEHHRNPPRLMQSDSVNSDFSSLLYCSPSNDFHRHYTPSNSATSTGMDIFHTLCNTHIHDQYNHPSTSLSSATPSLSQWYQLEEQPMSSSEATSRLGISSASHHQHGYLQTTSNDIATSIEARDLNLSSIPKPLMLSSVSSDLSLFPNLTLDSLSKELKNLLKNIPRKSREAISPSDQAAFRTCHPIYSRICLMLMQSGYDIRLGEVGRAALKKEISRRLKGDAQLRERCVSVVCRLKNANVLQLLQMAEISGCLDMGLEISSKYWREYSRKQRPGGMKRDPNKTGYARARNRNNASKSRSLNRGTSLVLSSVTSQAVSAATNQSPIFAAHQSSSTLHPIANGISAVTPLLLDQQSEASTLVHSLQGMMRTQNEYNQNYTTCNHINGSNYGSLSDINKSDDSCCHRSTLFEGEIYDPMIINSSTFLLDGGHGVTVNSLVTKQPGGLAPKTLDYHNPNCIENYALSNNLANTNSPLVSGELLYNTNSSLASISESPDATYRRKRCRSSKSSPQLTNTILIAPILGESDGLNRTGTLTRKHEAVLDAATLLRTFASCHPQSPDYYSSTSSTENGGTTDITAPPIAQREMLLGSFTKDHTSQPLTKKQCFSSTSLTSPNFESLGVRSNNEMHSFNEFFSTARGCMESANGYPETPSLTSLDSNNQVAFQDYPWWNSVSQPNCTSIAFVCNSTSEDSTSIETTAQEVNSSRSSTTQMSNVAGTSTSLKNMINPPRQTGRNLSNDDTEKTDMLDKRDESNRATPSQTGTGLVAVSSDFLVGQRPDSATTILATGGSIVKIASTTLHQCKLSFPRI